MNKPLLLTIILGCLALTSCSYNPFISDNHLTGSATGTVVGAGVGAGGAALMGASKPVVGLAAIIGGAVGYYVTSLRYDAAGLIARGGEVYTVGDLVGIYIPSDCIFQYNSDELRPGSIMLLDSVAAILKRYPHQHIFLSANTSGFYSDACERDLSQRRAQRIAGYLWSKGINQFRSERHLSYIGYGDYFPIASNLTNAGVRRNSRIQITVYPDPSSLNVEPPHDYS